MRKNTTWIFCLRTAITVSIVTVYLVLVSLVAFFQARGEGDELPRLTETMLTSFTTIVAIIVPFYFGTSAYVQVKKQELENKSNAAD